MASLIRDKRRSNHCAARIVVVLKRGLAVLFILIPAVSSWAESPIVDRVDTTAFLQIEVDNFSTLSPKQQALAYWLNQSAIAIDPIVYDQLSRFGLRQKRLLEAVVSNKAKVDPAIYGRVSDFTKLFWANKGNHNETTAQKFMPKFTADELKQALGQAGRQDLVSEVDALALSLFDAEFEPLITSKSPSSGKDIIQASANNFYFGVTLADLKDFSERYALNSRVVKDDGKLTEQAYRAGTPDGKVPPGLYARYLTKANESLEKARAYTGPAQSKVIADLIRYYQTGEYKDWLQFNTDWVQDTEPVDFANGFIDVYRDARAAKGTSQSFVVIRDREISNEISKIASNAQYFEDRAPWDERYKKKGMRPPVADAVETTIQTGDFHVATMGDSLPNEVEIRAKYGSKNFLFFDETPAEGGTVEFAGIYEFSASRKDADRDKKYRVQEEQLRTILHEVIGHGSGKLSPRLTHDPGYYLKEYYVAMEEARADLVALWNVFDPKLKELSVVSSDEVGKAMYDVAALQMLVQLRRIPKGDTIQEDRARARQLIAGYIMDKTGAIGMEDRDGKTSVYVKDYGKMREGVGMLLAELTRIKAEGDYAAIKALIDKYGVHIDSKLRDQVVERFRKLDMPIYFAGVNADLTAQFDGAGNVTKVHIDYPRNYVKQQLSYSAMYPEP
jgi:dipeptidyl-peptidase-3